ncbi:NAD-dependent deacetylase sirtuin-7 [Plectosphaerella plurivora]|uniref:protein acetyllysine N-acetyltransferase n=1 Tax=Plectosphaerella plurivora TaxID=936078 RepID=A0A9P8V2M2_9PEZI|nr:NAD-dependent deacetylase sirtuin-7 [Plectosphaerella plurivora]
MASTWGSAVADEERQEPGDAVARKAAVLAERVRESKHFLVFTGAGISTSAGIPDFRGPEGAWTRLAQGRQPKGKANMTLTALPTPTHMALVALQERGLLKYLVSQNCDGLHRRSGILPELISELHGNSNREYCKDCGKEYIRDQDFRAVANYEKTVFDHRTGRKCADCDGDLHDTIINFGEYLPEQPLERARDHAKKADLCLVLGSSLTVPPACTIPETVGKRKGVRGRKAPQLSICNLQATDKDGLCAPGLRIHAKTDDLMIQIMANLDIPIPEFILRRRLTVEIKTLEAERHQATLMGVDVDGTPVTFLRSVRLEGTRRPVTTEPYVLNHRGILDPGAVLGFELDFMGHYGEPNLELSHEHRGAADASATYLLEYNPRTGTWETTRLDMAAGGEQAVGSATDAAPKTVTVPRLEKPVFDFTDDEESML